MAATSALGGALKPVPTTDDTASNDYNAALEKIKAALDAREQRGFDPTLLAMAQGFLAPTKTGSFGESLGQAAGNVATAQQQMEKEAMDNAQLRLQLAQAEKEQANLSAAQKAFQQSSGIGATGSASQGKTNAGEFQPVTLEKAMQFIAAFPNQKELGARMMEAAKMGLDRYSQAQNGIVFDKMSGKYLNMQDIPGQVQADFATPFGTYKMTPNEYSRFNYAQQVGLGKEWMSAFKKGEHYGVDQLVAQKLEGKTPEPTFKKPAEPTGKPAEAKPTEGKAEDTDAGRMTVAQQEAQAAAQKETATQRAKGENTRYQTIMDNGQAATSKIATYKTMENVVSRPGMDKMLGYFERPDFLSAAGKFIEEGRFGVPQVREILQNLGAPQELIDNKQLMNSLVNQVGVEFSRLNKGQGAVSDYERSLYQSLGPNMKDPIGAFRKKVEMLNARAEFERQIARDLRTSKMDADEFVLSGKQYETALSNYYRTLERIVYGGEAKKAAPSGPMNAESLKQRRDALRGGI